jgi:S1-C subfamily serine protease
MKYSISLSTILLLILFSCMSQKGLKEKEGVLEPESYIETGYSLLELPTDDEFIDHINNATAETMDDKHSLLAHYLKKQEEMTSHFLEKGDFSQARHFFYNLFALRDMDEKEIENFDTTLIKGYGEKEYYAYQKYLKIKQNKTLNSDDYYPLLPVAEYGKLLVEVRIKRLYKTRNELIRRSYPYGTGILIGNNYILTAFHVVESVFYNSTTDYDISIKYGERIIEGVKVRSWDSLTDLALLQLNEELVIPYDFYTLLGNSDALQQGFEVYCLGHSMGLTSSLTKGIVSSIERKALEVGTWIQVDADISPGASGGLMIGSDGLIYGMLVSGFLFEDINFAVPSLTIMSVIDQLINQEHIRRPWLGLLLDELTAESGKVNIIDVFPSSSLTDPVIAAHDTLLAINETELTSIDHAQKIINGFEAGNIVKLKIKKEYGEEIKDYYVKLKKRPDHAIYNATRDKNKLTSLYPHFGFRIDPKKIKRFYITYKNNNITLTFYKVLDIRMYSILDDRGVKQGDYIGFLSDFFWDKTRYIEILHLPEGKPLSSLKNIEEYIYYMRKDKYDENIL